MLTNAKFQHLGFATPDIDTTVKFYTEDLGFEVIHRTATPDGLTPIVFIRNGAMTYEVYEVAYDSTDIEADYKKAVDGGYKITTSGIEGIPTVFDNGVRYFKIAGPSGEEVEFCQIL